MGVNPQKIDTLLALCANSNQKAAKNSKAAMFFDKFWHFVKILRLYKQTVYDLRSLWIIESSRNVVICKKTSNVLMLRQIRIFCLAKIIRKLYEHACGLFFSRHYSATLWYDVKESFLFRERAEQTHFLSGSFWSTTYSLMRCGKLELNIQCRTCMRNYSGYVV